MYREKVHWMLKSFVIKEANGEQICIFLWIESINYYGGT
jgi:hypothetical protein